MASAKPVYRATLGDNGDDDGMASARAGAGRIVPAVERACTPDERAALGNAASVPGETTFDIHLNGRAVWRNVPAAVWRYKLGGYQVLKKWLSYRERDISGRALSPDEVRHFTDTARRIVGCRVWRRPR